MTGPYTRISPDTVLRSPATGLSAREAIEKMVLDGLRISVRINGPEQLLEAQSPEEEQYYRECIEEARKLHNRFLRRSGLDGEKL